MENITVVEILCDLLDEVTETLDNGPRRNLITFVKDRAGHDRRYAIDCSKLQNTLGWEPEESFESGLRKTVDWYLKNRPWVDRVRSGEYQSWVKEHYGE